MQFVLSKNSPINTVFSNIEGQAIYKVETPFRVTGRTTTVQRIIPNNLPETPDDDVNMRDTFAHLAKIEWHTFRPTTLWFRDNEVEMNTYLRPQKYKMFDFAHLDRSRVFTGPDGREYIWSLGNVVPKLDLNDGSGTPVARYHRKKFKLFGESQPPYLEIFEGGQGIVDEIVVTFVYVEKLRSEKENARRSRASQFAAAG